jgi:hypothetical protein
LSQRFGIQEELDRIDSGLLQDAGKEWGTEILWYRFRADSEVDEIYDVGAPRRYGPAVTVPVLWALRTEGQHGFEDSGLDPSDSLQFAVGKSVLRDWLGWKFLDRGGHTELLRDRVRYEGRLFTVDRVDIQGQLEDRDVILGVVAREVRESTEFVDTPSEPSVYD